MAIKGELYVEYNGEMVKAHLTTEADLVEGLDQRMESEFGGRIIRDTCANLISSDTIFEAGTIVVESDTKYFKIADGTSRYTELEYINGRNGALNGLIVEVMKNDGTYDEQGVDDVILEFV